MSVVATSEGVPVVKMEIPTGDSGQALIASASQGEGEAQQGTVTGTCKYCTLRQLAPNSKPVSS